MFSFVLAWVYCIDTVFSLALILVFSVLAKRLAENNISDMTYSVLSGTLNLTSISQSHKLG